MPITPFHPIQKLLKVKTSVVVSLLFVENNHNVDVIELLLDGGAELNARTAWGDTAAHYAARWGTFDVLQFLCEEGISVQKPKSKTHCQIVSKID